MSLGYIMLQLLFPFLIALYFYISVCRSVCPIWLNYYYYYYYYYCVLCSQCIN